MIPISRPSLPPYSKVAKHWKHIYESGMLTNHKYVEQLEKAVAAYIGVKECVAVANCTSGLILSFKALGIRGKVVVPAFTFMATAHALLWNNIEPVFADSNDDTMTVDTEDVERLCKKGVSAIMAVYTFGNPPDLAALEDIAQRSGIPLILDAAHALGGSYRGKKAGSFGKVEVFSLSPTKTLVSGEGGIIATDDKDLAYRLRRLRDYGNDGNYDCEWLGLNARMSEFHAALALEGLKILDENIKQRIKKASRYKECLADVPWLKFQKVREDCLCTYKDFAVIAETSNLNGKKSLRDNLAEHLQFKGIQVKKYFCPAVHKLKIYDRMAPSRARKLSKTEHLSRSVLCLPLHPNLADTEIVCIADAIRKAPSP